ncbi:hypothetical protein LP316_10875 [Thalassotalea sp. LPB0316]|uniref:hypothetical protein n=1 Tax=Thalassotalea sp. LPB0316 TaxID=2769490 RepID=UPI00186725FE|nr:hypothetical protein [Thalassotalea sp. LPB0316]QOL24823.1 hypothetical protein LP316_10875 [Thalassotalea sp. LPB0316]
MGNAISNIENDNLFKAVIYLPIAILFALLASDAISGGSNIFFQVMYVILALYFVLGTLGYFAHFTNDFFDGRTDH